MTIFALSLQVSSTAGPMEEAAARNGSSPTSLNVAAQLAPITVFADVQQSLYFLERAEFFSAQLLSGHLLVASLSNCSEYILNISFERSFACSKLAF